MIGGGTKLPRSSPCSSSSASHSASSTSLLRPGRIFTCWALTSFNLKERSSSRYHTGFQYEPVASIAMSVTPCVVNQSTISSSAPVKERKVRVCLRRPRPPGAGVRTHATTSSCRCRSRRNARSARPSQPPRPRPGGTGPAGPTDQRRCEACTRTTVRGAGKAPGVSLRNGFTRTKRERAQPAPTGFSSFEAACGRAMGSQRGIRASRPTQGTNFTVDPGSVRLGDSPTHEDVTRFLGAFTIRERRPR